MASATSDKEPNSKESIIVHLESLATANFAAVNDRDFTSIEGMNFDKPVSKYSDEHRRHTPSEKLYLAKHICEAYPEYHLKILDMVTTLEGTAGSDEDIGSVTRARSSILYERTGYPPGIVTKSVLVMRYECVNRHWAVVSYETMPGGNIWGGEAT